MTMPRFAIICALVGLVITIAGCGPSRQTANEAAAGYCEIHRGLRKIEYWHEPDWSPYPSYYEAECRDGSTIDE